jgi:hypothetical protein
VVISIEDWVGQPSTGKHRIPAASAVMAMEKNPH